MEEDIGLFKRALEVFFGLDGDTVETVVSLIRREGQLQNIRDVQIRRRAGGRAMKLFDQVIDAASSEGDVKYNDQNDQEGQDENQHDNLSGDNGSEGDVHMKFDNMESVDLRKTSLREFLVLSELQMEVGTDEDPQEVLKRVRLAQRNPVRAANDERERALAQQKEIASDQTNPEKSSDMRTAQTKAKAATLQARDVRRKQGRQGQMQSQGIQGTAGGMTESVWKELARELSEECECDCHEVYIHEATGDIYEGDELLTEGFRRQFKRFGNEFRKKFRCMSGPKAGKLVTNAADCGKRPDPKKVRKGRAIMRARKHTIVRKSKIAKRTAPSKVVTKINKRLMGMKV